MTTPLLRAASLVKELLRPLAEFWLLALLVLTAIAIFLLSQLPFAYDVDIGREDGPGSDLPFVVGWNTAEDTEAVSYRWSAEHSIIQLSGLPRTTLVATLLILPANGHPQLDTAATAIQTPAMRLATLPISSQARVLHLLAPEAAAPGGRLQLGVEAPTWTPPGDPRVLGVSVDALRLAQVADAPVSRPLIAPVPLRLFWPLVALPLFWLPIRWWSRRQTISVAIALAMCCLLLIALVVDRPRFALAAGPALVGLLTSAALAIVMRTIAERVSLATNVGIAGRFLNALALLFFILFALRYAGRLYPFSMPGDVGFHINRQHDVLRGSLILVSRHRGIDFPYPPALYMLLLPFRLFPIAPGTLVEFADALLGALGVFAIAFASLYTWKREQVALFVALAYALLAPAIMALWWSFLPHIVAQEFVVLLLAAVVIGWPALGTGRGIVWAAAGLVFLFATHFGFYLNVSLLLCLTLAALYLRDRRGRPFALGSTATSARLGLLLAFVLAQVAVVLLIYSAFLPLIMDKLVAFRAGGMGAVQGGREATSRAALWDTLWTSGLVAHYATIGSPLALLGAYRLMVSAKGTILPLLTGVSLAVVVVQGAFPFLTSSTITTRWLSFAAWIVGLGLGLLLDVLWSRGRTGRIVVFAVLGWIGWSTLLMWVQALAYRVRPPEPF